MEDAYGRLMKLAAMIATDQFAPARYSGQLAQDLRCAIDDAMRYRWLRDYALEVVIDGPMVCSADKWGELRTQSNGRHLTRDGHDLDAEIDTARAAYAEAETRRRAGLPPNVRGNLPAEAGLVSPVRDDSTGGADRAYKACRSGSG